MRIQFARYARRSIYSSIVESPAANHDGTTDSKIRHICFCCPWLGAKRWAIYRWSEYSVRLLHKLLTDTKWRWNWFNQDVTGDMDVEMCLLYSGPRSTCLNIVKTRFRSWILKGAYDSLSIYLSLRYCPDHLLIRDSAGSGITLLGLAARRGLRSLEAWQGKGNWMWNVLSSKSSITTRTKR
jgi:hypothetical protein